MAADFYFEHGGIYRFVLRGTELALLVTKGAIADSLVDAGFVDVIVWWPGELPANWPRELLEAGPGWRAYVQATWARGTDETGRVIAAWKHGQWSVVPVAERRARVAQAAVTGGVVGAVSGGIAIFARTKRPELAIAGAAMGGVLGAAVGAILKG